MRLSHLTSHRKPPRNAMRGRHRFTVLTAVVTVLLMSWGAFVTSIDAGLAVPDWPTSFDSYDPFNPWPDWWTVTPVLAEHGHRLLGALVGLLTLILASWTIYADDRRWMKVLSVAVLFTVMLQGVLGGLRVIWVSLDLAVVHACVAQIFFASLVCMAIFTSPSWVSGTNERRPTIPKRVRVLTVVTVFAVFAQIIFGALLRHPGTGIDLVFAGVHIFWAFVVVALILASAQLIRSEEHGRPLGRARNAAVSLLAVQFMLGMTAFFVLLDEQGMVRPSNLQVIVNTSHMVVGALLMGATVAQATYALGWRAKKVHRFMESAELQPMRVG